MLNFHYITHSAQVNMATYNQPYAILIRYFSVLYSTCVSSCIKPLRNYFNSVPAGDVIVFGPHVLNNTRLIVEKYLVTPSANHYPPVFFTRYLVLPSLNSSWVGSRDTRLYDSLDLN
jgi:hypothetical protein